MKTNHRSPKVEKKQYLRYMKTFLWAKRKGKDELIEVVRGKKMDNYPTVASSLEQAVTDMEAESQLHSTGLSMTDLYAIKEVLDLINKNDTETASGTNGDGHQEDEISDGHLQVQGDSEVLNQPSKKRVTRSRKGNKSKHDGDDQVLGRSIK